MVVNHDDNRSAAAPQTKVFDSGKKPFMPGSMKTAKLYIFGPLKANPTMDSTPEQAVRGWPAPYAESLRNTRASKPSSEMRMRACEVAASGSLARASDSSLRAASTARLAENKPTDPLTA